MSKRNKSDDSGDDPGFNDSDLALIRENDWTVDATGNVFDDHGNELPPGVVAGAIVVDEMDIAAAKRADGLDAMFAPSVGTPPAPFVRPGTPIDSDGLMGAPAELQGQAPGPDDFAAVGRDAPPESDSVVAARQAFPDSQPEGEQWVNGAGVSPPPDTLSQATAAGSAMLDRFEAFGTDPASLKADHRAAHNGQYVTGPMAVPGTPPGPSHEIARVDLADDASASRFIGTTRAPTPPSVPTVRVVPVEETKGATL